MLYKIVFLMLMISQLSACSSYRSKKSHKRFMDIDKNSDGKISEKEWNLYHKEKFISYDKDKDGYLTKTEFKQKKRNKKKM